MIQNILPRGPSSGYFSGPQTSHDVLWRATLRAGPPPGQGLPLRGASCELSYPNNSALVPPRTFRAHGTSPETHGEFSIVSSFPSSSAGRVAGFARVAARRALQQFDRPKNDSRVRSLGDVSS